jgi:hypothetical protein
MRYCPECFTELAPDAVHCPSCEATIKHYGMGLCGPCPELQFCPDPSPFADDCIMAEYADERDTIASLRTV